MCPAQEPDQDPAPNRRERRTIETRRTLIDTARTLFEQQGFAATTVDEIAAAADVAPRTFFRYFPTKETLLFADFDEVRRQMLDALEQRPEHEDPLESLALCLAELVHEVDRRRDDIVWGFRLCAQQGVEGVYERTMIKESSHEQIADFIAGRLGVDTATDPRPLTWATAAMAVFGNSLKYSGEEHGDGSARSPLELFDELLASTADALRTMSTVRHRPR